jgi:hypothetical protein
VDYIGCAQGLYVEDPIYQLLEKLIATEDLAEFDSISLQLKSLLHERIENLRRDARALKHRSASSERRRRPRNVGNEP